MAIVRRYAGRTIISMLYDNCVLSANAGMPESAGQRIAVAIAPRAIAEVRPVSYQRVATANFAYRSATSGRVAIDPT